MAKGEYEKELEEFQKKKYRIYKKQIDKLEEEKRDIRNLMQEDIKWRQSIEYNRNKV